MPYFRMLQHLLPNALAWQTTTSKTLRKFFTGIAGVFEDARDFIDLVYMDQFPATTRELAEYETQLGCWVNASDSESTRRTRLAAAWQETGGQSKYYIQGILQAAGFPVYVHDWWYGSDPRIGRNPQNYTVQPMVGTEQCSGISENQAYCSSGEDDDGDPLFQSLCNRLLMNNPRYLVNENLTQRAPPPIPDDTATWPYFIYIGPETLDTTTLVQIPNARKVEFERLLLKLCPTQHWIVVMTDYVTGGVFDASFDPSFE